MKQKKEIEKNRSWKKRESIFIIANLFLSMFAFCFIINGMEVVRGDCFDGTGTCPILQALGLQSKSQPKAPTTQPAATKSSGGVATTGGTAGTGTAGTTGNALAGLSPANLAKYNSYQGNPAAQEAYLKGLGLNDAQIKEAMGSSTAGTSGGGLNSLLGIQTGSILDAAVTGLMWGGIGALVGSFVGGNGATAGFVAGLAGGMTYNILKYGLSLTGKGTPTSLASSAPYIGIAVAVVVFVLMYKKESTEVVSFNCLQWQAPVGGGDCEKCNTQESETGEPCSEYRCRSLGQACQLLNAGTKEEKCAWVNPKDTTSPQVKQWEDVLTKGYKYTEVQIRPPGRGMKIIRTEAKDGCVKAFEPLEFGVQTDEPAQCKIDYNHTLKYDDMAFFFGESNLYLYNHTQKLRLPSPAAIQAAAPELKHDGTYTLYTRCQDANGNYNVDEFAIRFCVEKGPDVTAPKIEGTNIANNMPIKFNQTSADIEVYVNEPSECKWSREDRTYDNMENQMSCATQVWEMNNNLVYTCRTTLTGLKDRQDNIFYFRCKDQPGLAGKDEGSRNVNQQGYKYTLKGTEALNIVSVAPNETIKDSTDVVPVNLGIETSNGYDNGKATCYYSTTGNERDFVQFLDTNSNKHKQRQDLTAGSYTYYFKCVDLGGNRDDKQTSFVVETDRTAPAVARLYKENELLKIVTTENSDCRYSTQSCDFKFEDGVDMPYSNQTSHVAEWHTDKTYYIRCTDEYGNMPYSNECSMVLRPFDVVKQVSA